MTSLSSAVTDSSAASSSWGSGSRVANGAVNTLPDGRKLTPLARLVKDKGFAVGLVTTATVTHATPAGFAAAQADRDDEASIAPQYLGLVDIVLGGGKRFFAPASRKDGCDLTGDFRRAGYRCVGSRMDLLGTAAEDKILGLFADGHIPYRIDRSDSSDLAKAIPTLAEMAGCALRSLEKRPSGFLLQVEGARIDHAAHANDAAALLWEQLEFDDALGECLAFQSRHPETLIVATTDHGNANPGLNGMGSEYGASNAAFARLAAFRVSHQELARRLGGKAEYSGIKRAANGSIDASPEVAAQIVKDATGLTLRPDEVHCLCTALAGNGRATPNDQQNSLQGALGAVFSNHTGIGWTGTSHTSDLSLLSAIGPGSGDFAGLLLNTNIFDIVTRWFGVHYRNSSLR